MPKRLIRQKTAAKAPLDAAIINAPSKESNGTNVIEALKGSWRGHHVPPIVVSDDIDLETVVKCRRVSERSALDAAHWLDQGIDPSGGADRQAPRKPRTARFWSQADHPIGI